MLKSIIKKMLRVAVLETEKLYYYFPNVRQFSVDLSVEEKGYLDEFREKGIIKLWKPEFEEIADYLNEHYFAPLEQNKPVEGEDGVSVFARHSDRPGYDHETLKKQGVLCNATISFLDERLFPVLFNDSLAKVLYNYYHRQPYYRNYPILISNFWDGASAKVSSSNFHVDGHHQISVMFLANALTEDDTHMELALGSHKTSYQNQFGISSAISDDFVYKNFEIEKLIGPKGTLFMFDASTIHRGLYTPHTHRRLLHLNITTGHNVLPTRYDYFNNRSAFDSTLDVTKRMVDKIKCEESGRVLNALKSR